MFGGTRWHHKRLTRYEGEPSFSEPQQWYIRGEFNHRQTQFRASGLQRCTHKDVHEDLSNRQLVIDINRLVAWTSCDCRADGHVPLHGFMDPCISVNDF